MIFHRKSIGVELWNNRSRAMFQSILVIIAMNMTALMASIGGKISKGSSLLDWLPIKINLSSSLLLSEFAVWSLFLIGLLSFIVLVATKSRFDNMT
mgnify:CR=1 FL=1